MTKEEIKQAYSMTDVIGRYGFRPNRSGFIRCPFHHGDNDASLKIYKDSFFCFGCGASGDIFDFVMRMDNVSFKEAFYSLGGSYDHDKTRKERRYARRDFEIAKITQKKNILTDSEIEFSWLSPYLTALVCAEKELEPLSDAWCLVEKEITKTYARWMELWEEVSEKRQNKT